ncbi:MAG TPA: DinB family protein [Candidatus Angelobacter sp.]|nr:DinB family protein [Candidatus Angelobacter sp.]
MKIIWIFVLLVAGCVMIRAQSAQPSLPRTVTAVFDRNVASMERAILSVAEAMPEDRYAFVPVDGEFTGVRSFAQLVKHVAVDNYVDAAALLKEKPPVDTGIHENGPDSIKTKKEILIMLRDSFTYLHKAMATVNRRNLMQPVDFPGTRGGIPRLMIVTAALSHPWDLYGQMIEYLRMNGIDPQK